MTTTAGQPPLAVICTPVFNGENYLDETMACVQAQTYPNLAHVLLDNASTDLTPEIISRYVGGKVPIIVARNPQTVLQSENFNRVLAMMPEGTAYFRVLCADDLMLPEAMTRMIGVMELDDEVGVVAAAETDGKWSGWPPGNIFDGLTIVGAYFHGQLPTGFGQCLYRKRFYDQRAPQFFDHLNNMDVDVGLAVMSECKVGYVHEPQVFTRTHESTITSREIERDKMHMAEWLVFLERYGEPALGAKEVRRIGRQFRRYYFRRMLRWRFAEGRVALVHKHLERLRLASIRPGLAEYFDAVVDWPLKQLGVREGWSRYPS